MIAAIRSIHRLLPTLLPALLFSSTALANIAAVQPDPALVAAPARAAGTGEPKSRPVGLHVVAERLVFDCSEEDGRPVCDFRAIYRVKNRSGARQAVVAAFLGVHTSGVKIRVADRAVSHTLTDAEVKRIDAAVQGVIDDKKNRTSFSLERQKALSHAGFKLTVEAGQEARVEATGRVRPGRLFVPSYAVDAVRTRHPLLGTRSPGQEYDLEYLVAPIRTWGSVGAIQVMLRHPASWEVGISTTGDARKPRQQSRADGDSRTVELALSPAVDLLRVHVGLPPRVLLNGGVLLGLGGTLDDPRGFRARLGYEIAAPGWLFHGLTVDTDFTDELVVTPTWEAATSGVMVIIPSLAVGLGVPVQVKPEVTAGIRMQLTLQWPFIGLVTTFDLYPGLDTGGRGFFQATMLAQIAL
jgi:hypothetical protein